MLQPSMYIFYQPTDCNVTGACDLSRTQSHEIVYIMKMRDVTLQELTRLPFRADLGSPHHENRT